MGIKPKLSAPIRVALVGAGYFGRFHAKHLVANPAVRLVGVADVDETRARAIAQEYGIEAVADYRALIGLVDAASIVVPTPIHFEVARDFIEAGVHALVEKPITNSVESASMLADLAEARGQVLQVGHVERFSPTFRILAERTTRPLYIESYRISPWKKRAGEVDVVLDLMIHDIDIILGLVTSQVVSVHAIGAPILNPTPDLANARIVFESGCVANVTASRVSYKTERRIRVFQPKSYLIGDFANYSVDSYTVQGDPASEGLKAIKFDSIEVPKGDSLAIEIAGFVDCIISGRKPIVDGRDGCEAIRVAQMVTDSISEHHRGVEALLAQ